MDFQYSFHQAHHDRLEEAGLKFYRYRMTEGYVVEDMNQVNRQFAAQRVKRAVFTTLHLANKQEI